METMMNGIYNFLNFIDTNWTMICAIIVLGIAIYEEAKIFFAKSREEKIEIAKQQVKEIMLRLVTEAEKDYLQWIKAGEIKRAQVIDQVFEKYPILLKVTNQAELITWIDDTINEALKKMRKIFEDNSETKVE